MNTTGMQTAMRGLDQALDAPHQHGAQALWRTSVGQRMASLRECLVAEQPVAEDGWLSARSGVLTRERKALLGRMSAFDPRMQQAGEVDSLRAELKRLLVDIGHHLQRRHDLAYDDVELELGGSE